MKKIIDDYSPILENVPFEEIKEQVQEKDKKKESITKPSQIQNWTLETDTWELEKSKQLTSQSPTSSGTQTRISVPNKEQNTQPTT